MRACTRSPHPFKIEWVMRQCTKCLVEKPTSEFNRHPRGRDGLYPQCKQCVREDQVQYRTSERGKAVKRKNSAKERLAPGWSDKQKDIYLRRTYGITLAEYRRLLRKQRGVCKICKGKNIRRQEALHVDHCHRTGRVRGLLCIRCNQAIGAMEDDPVLLRRAAAYLEASG